MTDLLTLLERAVDQAKGVLAGVDDADLDLPTPCQSWSVRTLSRHLMHDLDNYTAVASGGQPDYGGPMPELPSDRVGTFESGSAGLLRAWRDAGDLDRTVTLQIGELPVSFLVSQQITEFAVHAWDLAAATGQPVNWDHEIGTAALGWTQMALKPEFRGDDASGHAFGPEVAAPPGASPQDQLVAFAGRDPAWSAS